MNALPAYEPPEHRLPPHKAKSSQQLQRSARPSAIATAPTPQKSTRTRSRVNSHPIYAHRRQGLEVTIKLVTYSALSLFGIVTLIQSIGYNWAQHTKLQYLATELQDARIRTAQVNHNFSRSFAPELEKRVMEENSYKVAPDRVQIVIANPAATDAGRSPNQGTVSQE